jgi:hypothetical protein
MVGLANPSAYGGLAKGRSPEDEFVRKAKVRLSAEVRPLADIQHRDRNLEIYSEYSG